MLGCQAMPRIEWPENVLKKINTFGVVNVSS